MMTSNKKAILLIGVVILVLFTAAIPVALYQRQMSEAENSNDIGVRTFADWTEYEVFESVPAMLVDNTGISTATDYGANNYVIDVDGTTLEDYDEYLKLLESVGFEKYASNSLDDSIYTANYTKGELVLTITHVVRFNKTYISASNDLQLSEHLIYDEAYISANKKDAKTTLSMLELYDFGNSFIFQLKNGHFIVNDGGMPEDAKYLIDYLESLAPHGEKPVIEAWFMTHAHVDHVGILATIIGDVSLAQRIYVEEIYFNQPSDDTVGRTDPRTRVQIQNINAVTMAFKTTDGKKTPIYRPQTGQRYYFNDITIDVVYSQEQLILENYSGDFNDTSTWLMYTIDGQKALFGGDGEWGGMTNLLRTYSEDYFVMDIFQALHHNGNTWDDFTDYCTVETVLAADDVLRDSAANRHLAEVTDEILAWGDGGKVLTFPYEVGTAKTLPSIEWIYHPLRGTK